jgi:hypothetical protein
MNQAQPNPPAQNGKLKYEQDDEFLEFDVEDWTAVETGELILTTGTIV